MDMNKVVQEFVTRALREKLQLTTRAFPAKRKVWFDKEKNIGMEPDLSWWDSSECTFVGDVKYKTLQDKPVHHADLYQLLAYTTALDLPGGVLIYAEGGQPDACHDVCHAGKRLVITSLDLSGSISELHDEISELAVRVEVLQRQAATHRRAA